MTARPPAPPSESTQPVWAVAPEPPDEHTRPVWAAAPEPPGPSPAQPAGGLPWQAEPPAPPTQSLWHAGPVAPAAPPGPGHPPWHTEPPAPPPAESWIPQQRIGVDQGDGAAPGGPPPLLGAAPLSGPPAGGAPGGEEGGQTGKSGPSTGLIVGLVLVGATVLVALALAVPALLERLSGGGDESGTYTVGECVVQDGADASPADCSAPDAYEIVSQVDNLEECDPTQPTIQVDGPPAQIYCLIPAGAAPAPSATPEPEPTTE